MILIILFAHLSNDWRLLCAIILIPGLITCFLRLFMVESLKFNYSNDPVECTEGINWIAKLQREEFRVAFIEQWTVISKFKVAMEDNKLIDTVTVPEQAKEDQYYIL